MPAAGFLALLDDLASLLDDVALLSKAAVKKTAGVAGDDLAVGARQAVGLSPERELPVVAAMAKGSLLNKAWLVPSALALDALLPAALDPLLAAGGLYLCCEGVEKALHALAGREDRERGGRLTEAASRGGEDLLALERDNVRKAVRTDAVLSAEIVVISLGAVARAPLATKAAVVAAVSLAMTGAIYGLVALIVKADDVGLRWTRGGPVRRAAGAVLLRAMPELMKLLSAAGTAAMILVGGGILEHVVPGAHAAFAFAGRASSAAAGLTAGLLALGLGKAGAAALARLPSR